MKGNKRMEYRLWEKDTPYFDESAGQSAPALTPFLVNSKEKRGAVIVLPGGGYAIRADHEGAPIAQMINKAGVNAFVCSYRVAPYCQPVETGDALRAVRYVRYHAEKFNILPDKIAVLGFSAGGHLAVMTCEHFDYGRDDGDEIDKVSSRPDAGIFCYPVVTFRDPYTHEGTRQNLINCRNYQLESYFSGELMVPNDMPPAFIWHTATDGGVSVENSLMLATAMKMRNIPVELHVFPHGDHGLGLAEGDPSVSQWAKLLQTWLRDIGF